MKNVVWVAYLTQLLASSHTFSSMTLGGSFTLDYGSQKSNLDSGFLNLDSK